MGYFKNIYEAVTTTLEGMKITLIHFLFRRPITIQYPDVNVEAMLPDRFRGKLQVNLTNCIGCLNCSINCPISCIKIDIIRKEEEKARYITKFDIDMSKCMWCGLCVESCPENIIYFTKKFEGSTRNIEDLVLHFVKEPQKVATKTKKEEPKKDEIKIEKREEIKETLKIETKESVKEEPQKIITKEELKKEETAVKEEPQKIIAKEELKKEETPVKEEPQETSSKELKQKKLEKKSEPTKVKGKKEQRNPRNK